MKRLLLVLVLFSNLALIAQNNESEEAANILYQEGIALLQKEPLLVFDKIQALDKFQESKKLLGLNGIRQGELYDKNEDEIQALLLFFTIIYNRDSLLELTRFYPDSTFQSNTSYSPPFKSLINRYLSLKESTSRNAFFQLKHLNYTELQNNTSAQSLTFENYWPLEVLEVDKWLQAAERELRHLSLKARSEILQLRLQNKLDSLRLQENTANYERSKSFLQERITTSEQTAEASKKSYQRLKNIGIGLTGLLLFLGFLFWKKNDQLLRSKNQSLLEEKKRSEDLLSNMLPAEVVRQLKQKRMVKAQKYNSVSILFSDFKNFSQITETLSPEELVKELDLCFTIFDRIIDKYRLQKIKTIGDAYMCVGGLYTRGGNHVQRMVLAALEIQQFLTDRKIQQSTIEGNFFEARIGIHTGPVVAGVIGTKKIAFDLWGATVNVAQQMEQHSVVGKVNISGETFTAVKDRFDCEHRGKVIVKNKKEYDMYFVQKEVKIIGN